MKLAYFFLIQQSLHENLLKYLPYKLLAQSKLNGIADIISQTMLDGDISFIEFRNVLQEVEKYHQLKAGIRNQAKTKVRQITKGQ